jgi:hypothetical protein
MKVACIQWAIVVLVLLSTVAALSPRTLADQKGEENVSFRWAFGAMVGPHNDRRLVAITRDTALKTGDQLKLLVELKKQCFVYVIYHSGQDDVVMLFPSDTDQFTTDYQIAKRYFIPQGKLWFELDDNAGLETFHLIASATRLVELETLFNKDNTKAPYDKKKRSETILAGIRTIKKRYQKLTTDAERPVIIGGSVRGIDDASQVGFPDFDAIAAEVSTQDFYSRTFTIEHH